MSNRKPLPPAKPYGEDPPESEVRHSADEIVDEPPLKSFGEAISEVVLGAGEEGDVQLNNENQRGSDSNTPKPERR